MTSVVFEEPERDRQSLLRFLTQRLLTISGVADAVHIAIYYVGTVLLDFSGNLGDNRQYRPSPRPQVGGRPLLSAPFSLNFQAARVFPQTSAFINMDRTAF